MPAKSQRRRIKREILVFRDRFSVSCVLQFTSRGAVWVECRSRGLPFVPGKLQFTAGQARKLVRCFQAAVRSGKLSLLALLCFGSRK